MQTADLISLLSVSDEQSSAEKKKQIMFRSGRGASCFWLQLVFLLWIRLFANASLQPRKAATDVSFIGDSVGAVARYCCITMVVLVPFVVFFSERISSRRSFARASYTVRYVFSVIRSIFFARTVRTLWHSTYVQPQY